MASGYEVNGIDLDSIFAAYTTGTKPAATGYEVGGVDINQRYAPIAEGSAALATGYKISGGADLNTLFAAINTTTVTVSTQPSNVSGSSAAGDPSGTVTSGNTTCAGSGGTGSLSYTWHIASGTGVSFTNPNSATTGVKGSVNANSTNSGSMYCTISDGITSTNTNTVTWSLQNTTIPVSVGTQPGNVSGSTGAGNPSGTVTSGSTTCSGANGSGSYTYTWDMLTGGASFTNPNSATTSVTATVDAGNTITGTMRCTIKDSTGGTVNTNTVNWSLQNTTPAITVIAFTAHGSATLPAGAFATILFNSNGTETYENNANPSGAAIGNWDPGGDGSNYDIMATLASGTSPTGTALNTWTQVSSGVSWSLSNSSGLGNTVSCVLNISIRSHSTHTLEATGQVGLSALSNGSH